MIVIAHPSFPGRDQTWLGHNPPRANEPADSECIAVLHAIERRAFLLDSRYCIPLDKHPFWLEPDHRNRAGSRGLLMAGVSSKLVDDVRHPGADNHLINVYAEKIDKFRVPRIFFMQVSGFALIRRCNRRLDRLRRSDRQLSRAGFKRVSRNKRQARGGSWNSSSGANPSQPCSNPSRAGRLEEMQVSATTRLQLEHVGIATP